MSKLIDYLFRGKRTRAVAHGHTALTPAEAAAAEKHLAAAHLQIVGERTVRMPESPGQRIVRLAREHRGEHEQPAGSNRGPLVDACMAFVGWHFRPGQQGEPWCAGFASKVRHDAGCPLPGGGSASCYVLRRDAVAAGKWCSYPVVGAVGIVERDEHAVIATTGALPGGRVGTIAGNAGSHDRDFNGGKVAEVEYNLSSFSGWIHP